MFYVATLISHPERPAVTEALADKAARYLPHGRAVGWLASGVATDIPFLIDDVEDGALGAGEERAARGKILWIKRRVRDRRLRQDLAGQRQLGSPEPPAIRPHRRAAAIDRDDRSDHCTIAKPQRRAAETAL